MAIEGNIKALAALREKLILHRRKLVENINQADTIDGDAMGKVSVIVAIKGALDALKAARDEELQMANGRGFDDW
jgi:hypothetical protein